MNKVTGFLKTNNWKNAMFLLIKIAQLNGFNNEISTFNRNQTLPYSSKTLALYPFINKSFILRIDGRLLHATLKYGKKHPVLLLK